MPYCSRCGVEVDAVISYCPLCDAPIQKLPSKSGTPWPSEEASAPKTAPRNTEERTALARTITTLGFLIPAFIVITVDLFVSKGLDWSLIVLAALGAAWLWAILPLIFTRRPYLLIASITVVAVALEWGLGFLASDISWIIPIGMPIVISAGFLTGIIVLLSRRSKRLGGNLPGWILIGVGLLSVITDVLLSAWLEGLWRPGWSLIVAGTVFPISALLLYIHYRPSQRTRIRRYFHV